MIASRIRTHYTPKSGMGDFAAAVYVFNTPCESGIGYHKTLSFSFFDIYILSKL